MHNVLSQSQLSFGSSSSVTFFYVHEYLDEHALALDSNLSNIGHGLLSIDGGLDEVYFN